LIRVEEQPAKGRELGELQQILPLRIVELQKTTTPFFCIDHLGQEQLGLNRREATLWIKRDQFAQPAQQNIHARATSGALSARHRDEFRAFEHAQLKIDAIPFRKGRCDTLTKLRDA
jgi:hypothetical protein